MFEDKQIGMETGIDVENHASFKIFPSLNRYEAYLCLNNEVERVADGYLDQLASHLYGVKQLCFNASNDYFKLEIPVTVKGAWVTKDTFKRFLCFIDSKDLITKAKVIEGEMSQLIERSQRNNVNIKGDGANSSDKPELGRPLLDASRNELLRAMDFRLHALGVELEETLSQAAGTPSSICELNYLEKFCEHFGAMDMRLVPNTCQCSEISFGLPLCGQWTHQIFQYMFAYYQPSLTLWLAGLFSLLDTSGSPSMSHFLVACLEL